MEETIKTRPRKPSKPRRFTKTITFTLEPEQYEQFMDVSYNAGYSMAEHVRLMISNFLREINEKEVK